jgi:hypothetical protein
MKAQEEVLLLVVALLVAAIFTVGLATMMRALA